jgi:hypothetical protein
MACYERVFCTSGDPPAKFEWTFNGSQRPVLPNG